METHDSVVEVYSAPRNQFDMTSKIIDCRGNRLRGSDRNRKLYELKATTATIHFTVNNEKLA